MNSEGYFTNSDLLDYEKASKKVVLYLSNMLNLFCKDRSVYWMMGDRIKSLESINEKIKKKKKEKGSDFDSLYDLQDIAGLRVIFCDKDNLRPCTEELDKEIGSWSLEQFENNFINSIRKSDNCDIKNIYDFVELLMRNCPFIAIVKDYIVCQKESGYQSIHVIVDVRIEKTNNQTGETVIRNCPVEIQFRNYTQHLFDEFEHDIRYKKNRTEVVDCDDVFNACKISLKSIAEKDLSEMKNDEKKYILVR